MLGYNRGLKLADILERQRDAQLSKTAESDGEQQRVHHWGQSILLNGNKANNLLGIQNNEENKTRNIKSEASDSSKKISLIKEWFQQATSSTDRAVTRVDAEAFLASWDITASNVSSVIWQEWVDAITQVLSSPLNVTENIGSLDDSDDLSTAEYAYYPTISNIEHHQYRLTSSEGAAQITTDSVSVATTTTGANRYDQLNAKLLLDAVKHSFYGSPERDDSPSMPLSPRQSEDEEPLGGVVLETITESSETAKAAATPSASAGGEVLEWSSGLNRFVRPQESQYNLAEENLVFPMGLPRQLFSGPKAGDSAAVKLDCPSTSTLTTPERFRPDRVARPLENTSPAITTAGGLAAERDRELTRRMVALGMSCTGDSPVAEVNAAVHSSSASNPSNQSLLHNVEIDETSEMDGSSPAKASADNSASSGVGEAEALHTIASPLLSPTTSSARISVIAESMSASHTAATTVAFPGIAFDDTTTGEPPTLAETLQQGSTEPSLSPQQAESETCSVASSLSAPVQLRAPGKGFRSKGRVLVGKNRKGRSHHRCDSNQQSSPAAVTSPDLSGVESVSPGKASSIRLVKGLSAVAAGVLLLLFLLVTGLSPRLAVWQQSQQQPVNVAPNPFISTHREQGSYSQPSAAQQQRSSGYIPTPPADSEWDRAAPVPPPPSSSNNNDKSYFDLRVKLQPSSEEDAPMSYNANIKNGANSTTGSIVPAGPLAPLRWALRRIRRLALNAALAVLMPFHLAWKTLVKAG